jgi:NADH-dependent peroxiredoxin subunit F
MIDLIIIGGGPAGLTAAAYAIRRRLDVLLVSKDLGGKTNYHAAVPWIEEFDKTKRLINAQEIVNRFRNELEYLDFSRKMTDVDKVLKVEGGFAVITSDGERLEARAVIIATGTNSALLGVPNERQYMLRGLYYSALSYGPLFIYKKVAVVGDGELALHATADLATIAKQVTVVCQCTDPEVLETPLGKKLLAAENVHLLRDFEVIEVLELVTEAGKFARGLKLRNPNGQIIELDVDAVFVEKSMTANTRMVAGLVEMDEYGRIRVDSANRASLPGIFAAGDVTDSYGQQELIAIGEGAKAALSAYEYLLSL